MREVSADLGTPLSDHRKARARTVFLFIRIGAGRGKVGPVTPSSAWRARTLLRVSGHEMTVEKDGQVSERETVTDPLDTVRAFKARYTVPEIDGLPRFTGGPPSVTSATRPSVTSSRVWEKMAKPDVVGAPDILLTVSDEVVRRSITSRGKLDTSSSTVNLAFTGCASGMVNQTNRRLDELVARLGEGVAGGGKGPAAARPWRGRFCAGVHAGTGALKGGRRSRTFVPATSMRGGAVAAPGGSLRRRASISTTRCVRSNPVAGDVLQGPRWVPHRRLLARRFWCGSKTGRSRCARSPARARAGKSGGRRQGAGAGAAC